METRFGKFITGKYFPRLFWTFYIVLMAFLAARTDWAFRLLLGRTLGIPFLLVALAAVLVFFQQQIVLRLQGRAVKKGLGFLTCLLIYDLLLTLVWTLLCLVLPLAGRAPAAGTVLCAAVSALTVLVGYLHARSVKKTSCTIDLGTAGTEYKIALISDIHLGAFVDARHISRIVQKIQEIQPDMVLVCGDIIDVDNAVLQDEKEMQEAGAAFSRISAPDGVYAVLGNHDPQGIREAAAAGASLVLCGHTHRGQFFPVNFFTRWANGRHYFYGYESFSQTQAFISSGAGYFQLPVRIGTSNEVVSLLLRL